MEKKRKHEKVLMHIPRMPYKLDVETLTSKKAKTFALLLNNFIVVVSALINPPIQYMYIHALSKLSFALRSS